MEGWAPVDKIIRNQTNRQIHKNERFKGSGRTKKSEIFGKEITLTLSKPNKTLKKQKLRNTEYYQMQSLLDDLHAKSKRGDNFTSLIPLMSSASNIMLAYRNIRKNSGSRTPGTDGRTIKDLDKWDAERLIRHIQNKFCWYQPQSVRRVEIPKNNGKTRPLGIPTITDRLVQQCILQILEPICEAKFHPRSFGFRPNRGCEHAIAAAYFKMQKQHLHYVVDIDIQGFFEHVNHGKLLKQMWTMGIRDKKLLSILSAMLKAEVAGVGYPTEGTPQGGIISPLLSNIVLNELDWWISNQWETFKPQYSYSQGNQYQNLRKSKLKECYIVRYADDFKLFCRKRSDAVKLFEATKQWLKERLGLNISPEKSRIVNLKRHYSEFLGYRIKVHPKGKRCDGTSKYVVTSCLTEKSFCRINQQAHRLTQQLQHAFGTDNEHRTIGLWNSYVLGIHNYYQYATNVNLDFSKIAFSVRKSQKARLRDHIAKNGNDLKGYIRERYGKSSEIRYLNGMAILPLSAVQHRNPMNFKQSVNSYTEEGRQQIHKSLEKINVEVLRSLLESPEPGSAAYNDNRLAVYCAQKGMCAISGKPLTADELRFVCLNGKTEYKDIIMIHCIYLPILTMAAPIIPIGTLPEKERAKVNKLRSKQGLNAL